MLFKEIISDYCENDMEHANTLYGEKAELKQVVHIVTIGVLRINRISLKVNLNRDNMLVRNIT
jgi:hypothetical protein